MPKLRTILKLLFGAMVVTDCVLAAIVGAAAFALFTTAEPWLIAMGAACGAAVPGIGVWTWWRI